jgi:hypothetical protein
VLLYGGAIAVVVSLVDTGLSLRGATTIVPAPPGGAPVLRPVSIPRWPLPMALFGREASFIPYGFPAGSLGALYFGPTGSAPAFAVGISSGRQFWALPGAPNFVWPILPAPGLFIDTCVYGGGWLTWEWMRARSRRRRGLCFACGYGPWSQGTACPECGAKVQSAVWESR